MTTSGQRSDFAVEHHLSIALVRPESDEAHAWCAERLATDNALTWGRAYVVEPRYLNEILEAIVDDGFSVQLHG